MLKITTLALVGSLVLAGSASAQQPAANPAAPSNPAIATPSTPSATAPAPGANSFTEAQAKVRLEAQGFTGVTGLKKDNDGIWRGMATKAGTAMNVAVDYQGNVVQK